MRPITLTALILATACTKGGGPEQVFPGERDLSQPQSLEGRWFVEEQLDIDADITLAPGATVTFARDAGWWFADSGNLIAEGTEEEPITFIGDADGAGTWTGLALSGPANRLAHVDVSGAGSREYFTGQAASLYLIGDAGLTLSDTHLDAGGAMGFAMDPGARLASTTRLTVTAHDEAAARMTVDQATVFGGTHTLSDTTAAFVVLTDDDANLTGTWPALDVPWHLSGPIDIYSDLVIAAGAELAFATDAALWVNSEGSLAISGTESAPVVLRGQTDGAATWAGVILTSNDTQNVWTYADLSGAGSTNYFGPAIASIGVTGALSLSNVTIDATGGYGVYFGPDARILGYDAVTIGTSTEIAAHMPLGLTGDLDPASTYGTGATAGVELSDADLRDAVTVPALTAPYISTGPIDIYDDLTVAPGVDWAFLTDAALWVGTEGSLSAVGTAADPITFRGTTPVAGSWSGLVFASDDPNNQLTHVTVRDGGGSDYYCGAESNICVPGDSRLNMTDVDSVNSAGWGLFLSVDADVTQTSVSFLDNASGSVNPL